MLPLAREIITAREIELYYFTVNEVASILRLSDQHIRRLFQGKMIWHGQWMISPSDIQPIREKLRTPR